MGINGKRLDRKHKALGAKKIKPPGGKSGCFPALVTIALVGGGWLHMIATSAGWTT